MALAVYRDAILLSVCIVVVVLLLVIYVIRMLWVHRKSTKIVKAIDRVQSQKNLHEEEKGDCDDDSLPPPYMSEAGSSSAGQG